MEPLWRSFAIIAPTSLALAPSEPIRMPPMSFSEKWEIDWTVDRIGPIATALAVFVYMTFGGPGRTRTSNQAVMSRWL
jgi:hypothetical protein